LEIYLEVLNQLLEGSRNKELQENSSNNNR